MTKRHNCVFKKIDARYQTTLGDRIQDIQYINLKIKQKLSFFKISHHVVLNFMQYIFTISSIYIASIRGKKAKSKNDDNNIMINKTKNKHECDLYNVRKDRFGIPITKCVIPGFKTVKTTISR